MNRLWVCHGGKKDEFVPTAVETSAMALGWDEVNEDLSAFKDKNSVLELVRKTYPDSSDGTINSWADQLYKFVTDIAAGDLIVMRCKEKKGFFIGTVEGEYYFDSGSDKFRHRRPVKWKKEPVPRDIFEQDLIKLFGARKTLSPVKKNDAYNRIRMVLETGGFFNWAPFYQAVANALLGYKNKRKELLEEIIFPLQSWMEENKAPFTSLKDTYSDESRGPLKDICPFTIMATFNRGITNENREIIAEKFAELLKVKEPLPSPFSHEGIPVVDNRNSWFFGYEKERQPGDIDTLWDVFESGIKFAESNGSDKYISAFKNSFDKAIHISGGWKLTIGLYWVRPFDFLSLDKLSRNYLKEELSISIPNKLNSTDEYWEICDKLKIKFKEETCPVHSFPKLSLAAWFYPDPIPGHPNPAPIQTNAKNLIFYGPPGTGKTWKLNQLKKQYSEEKTLNRRTWLIQELSEVSWFDVIFATLYNLGEKGKVREISEHEYVRIKAESLGRKKNIKQTIWSTLQSHAPEDSKTVRVKNRGKTPTVFDKDKNSVWSLVNDWEEECQEQIELAETWKEGPKPESSQKRFEFVTFHQAYSYEDFVEGIRPKDEDGNMKYEVVPGIFKQICNKAKADPEQRYAIFIDEINRGNIASIFGELITLLETDKRVIYGEDGSPESGMTLTLPYSGERFGVPANLDVYGTMNTADRSIALLDTALRRRFQFQELMPDSSVIDGSSDGLIEDGAGGKINLRTLLEAINSRIRFLLSRDMTIGHSYLISVRNFDELKDMLLSRIIPLLQEYFYDDWHRIQLVFRDVGSNREKIEPQIIRHKQLKEVEVIGFDHDDFEDSIEYWVAPEDEITPDAIRKIYEESN